MRDHWVACCKQCTHDHLDGGDRVCDLRPYDCETPKQRAIVRWLTNYFVFSICPEFEDYQTTHKGATHPWVDPYIRYNIQNKDTGLFMCQDRHSDVDHFWGEYGDPFMLSFQTLESAEKYTDHTSVIRTSFKVILRYLKSGEQE